MKYMVYKASDTSRLNTTSMADDPDLTLSLEANHDYIIHALVLIDSGLTPDTKVTLNYSAAVTRLTGAITGSDEFLPDSSGSGRGDWINETTGLNSASGYTIFGSDTAGHTGCWYLFAHMRTAAAGTLSIAWAQNTSNASSTKVLAGSYLYAEDVTS